MGILLGSFCVLLVLFVMLLIVAVLVRLATWIANKCLGGSSNSGRRSSYEDEWDNDDDDYDRPARRRSGSGIPEPGLFKAMGIAVLWFIVMVIFGVVMNLALGIGMNPGGGGNNPFRGGRNNPFRGGGGGDPAIVMAAGCFQHILGFLVWSGMFTLLLPTTFPRALLVTVFLYLEGFALGVLIFIAVFVFALAADGGGGFR